MQQDILHIRDVVSKTITVTPQMMTITSDFTSEEFLIPAVYLDTVEAMFQFAYNRADEFQEGKNGVMLSISGGQYPERIGDIAQLIYEKVTK